MLPDIGRDNPPSASHSPRAWEWMLCRDPAQCRVRLYSTSMAAPVPFVVLSYFSPSFSAQWFVPASDELEDAVDNKGSCNSAVSMCRMALWTLTEGQLTDIKAQSTRESQLDGKCGLELAGTNLLGRELGGLNWCAFAVSLGCGKDRAQGGGPHTSAKHFDLLCGVARAGDGDVYVIDVVVVVFRNARTLIFLAVLSRIPVRRPVTPVASATPQAGLAAVSRALAAMTQSQTRPGQWLFAVQGSDYVTVSGRCEPHASCASLQQRARWRLCSRPENTRGRYQFISGFSHAWEEGRGER